MLHLDQVAIRPVAGGADLFPAISLTVAPGEVAVIMGASGSGKSTLLDFISGHLARSFVASGRVVLAGQDVAGLAPEARGIGILFQDALLFPHLSVGENLAYGLPRAVRGRAARQAAVAAALERAGLPGFAGRDPATLSGGQRSRVALMRALLARPRALLLDEPFSKLDAALRAEIRTFVFAHLQAEGIPALLTTHDPADAEAAGGQVYRLG